MQLMPDAANLPMRRYADATDARMLLMCRCRWYADAADAVVCFAFVVIVVGAFDHDQDQLMDLSI